MLKVKDARMVGHAYFNDLPIGSVYEDVEGYINIKVDHNKVIFKNDDDEWELIDITNEKVWPLDAELIITGRK